MTLLRRVSAEILGTGLLLATVVGSGIMAERLAGGNVAVALLANSLATGAGLVTLILTFGPISGAHFNPVVSLLALLRGYLAARDCAAYILGQVLGAFAGVTLAHVMYELPLITMSQHARAGMGLAASEFVATLGLLLVIALTARHRPGSTPFAVAAYIVAAYWFTASTSFANPAVTLARTVTDTFTGIRLADVPAFLTAQVTACFAAFTLTRWMLEESV